MPVWIASISYYVPPRVVTNDDIIRQGALKMRAQWIEKYVGARTRHWVEGPVAASDLAVEAARGADLTGFSGAIYVATVSPDHLTPSTASLVKRKLELRSHHPATDVNAACA